MSGLTDTISNALGFGPAQRQMQRNSNALGQATGQQSQIASTLSAPLSQYYSPAVSADASMSGINSQGVFNPNYDPYAQSSGSLINKYNESVAPQYNNAVSQAQHDTGSRFGGQANSLLPSEIGNIRNAQAMDTANYTRNLGVTAANTDYSRVGSLISSLMGGGRNAVSANQSSANLANAGYNQGAATAANAANNIFSAATMMGG